MSNEQLNLIEAKIKKEAISTLRQEVREALASLRLLINPDPESTDTGGVGSISSGLVHEDELGLKNSAGSDSVYVINLDELINNLETLVVDALTDSFQKEAIDNFIAEVNWANKHSRKGE